MININRMFQRALLVVSFLPLVAFAAPGDQASPGGSKNATSVNFEDLLIQGKHHFSNETVITVEEDKVLDSLLGIRKDFRDRVRRSATRH